MVLVPLRDRGENLRPSRRPHLEKLVARRLVEIPERARIVSRRPAVDVAHVYLAFAGLPLKPAVKALRLAFFVPHEGRRRRVKGLVVRGALRDNLRQTSDKVRLMRHKHRRMRAEEYARHCGHRHDTTSCHTDSQKLPPVVLSTSLSTLVVSQIHRQIFKREFKEFQKTGHLRKLASQR